MNTYSAHDMTELASITYRQLDHWTRQGYLTTVTSPTPGTGGRRAYDAHQAAIAVQLGNLARAGIQPSPAALAIATQIAATGRAHLGDYVIAPSHHARPATSTTTSTGAAA